MSPANVSAQAPTAKTSATFGSQASSSRLIAARMQGYGRGPAANIGLTVLGRGEFSLILATLAVEAGLDARIGPFVGFYVLILALVAPVLASRSGALSRLLPERLFARREGAEAA